MPKIIRIRVFLLVCIFCFGEEYPISYAHFSDQFENKTAVAILAFNRPEYLACSIQCIEKTPESQTLPFFFFLDGGSRAKQQENIALIESSSIKNTYILSRPTNFGIIKNHIDSKRFLFDWCQFDKIIVMEEDIEVSSDYFAKLLQLDEWANTQYANIGSVQLWSECFLTPEEKAQKITNVRQTIPFYSFVTYCLRRSVWNQISPFLYEYEKKFIDPLLGDEQNFFIRSKPGLGKSKKRILFWHKQMRAKIRDTPSHFSSENKPIIPSIFRNFHQIKDVCNQDMITAYILAMKGYTRLQTVVNHVKHIGENGFIEKNRDKHMQMRIDEIPFDFLEFKLVDQSVKN